MLVTMSSRPQSSQMKPHDLDSFSYLSNFADEPIAQTRQHKRNSMSTSSRRHSQHTNASETDSLVGDRKSIQNQWQQSPEPKVNATTGQQDSRQRRFSISSPMRSQSKSRRSISPKKFQARPLQYPDFSPSKIPRLPMPNPTTLESPIRMPQGSLHSSPTKQQVRRPAGVDKPAGSNIDSRDVGTGAAGYPNSTSPTRVYKEASSIPLNTDPTPAQQLRSPPTDISPTKSKRSSGKSRSSGEGRDGNSQHQRTRSKEKEKKSVLSRALQYANNAVLLDNAQNFDAAIEAYSEACTLLQFVMDRSSGEDDKRKLAAIQSTYTTRIAELRAIEVDHSPLERSTPHGDARNPPSSSPKRPAPSVPDQQASMRQSKYTPRFSHRSTSSSGTADGVSLNSIERSVDDPSSFSRQNAATGSRPSAARYHQSAESLSGIATTDSTSTIVTDTKADSQPPSFKDNHQMSWLDGADETRQSDRSSVHSVSSQNGIHRKHLRLHSGATEAEFDAALDAAVEAAYDGYDYYDEGQIDTEQYRYSNINNNELVTPLFSGQAAQGADRESIIAAAKSRVAQADTRRASTILYVDEAGDDSADEDEQLLDQLTKEYRADSYPFDDDASKPAIPPRQSDSSSLSGRTWKSSVASSATTAGTALSTVGEDTTISPSKISMPHVPSPTASSLALSPPLLPPPLGKPPPPPPLARAATHTSGSSLTLPQSPSVWDRRLSGKDAKQRLKIETASPRTSHTLAPVSRERSISPSKSRSVSEVGPQRPLPSVPPPPSVPHVNVPPAPESSPAQRAISQPLQRQASAPFLRQDSSDSMLTGGGGGGGGGSPAPNSPPDSVRGLSPQSTSPAPSFSKAGDRMFLRKNASALSLRNRPLLTGGSEGSDPPSTPMDFGFSPLAPPNRHLAPTSYGHTPSTTPIQSSFSRLHRTPLTTPVTASFSRLTPSENDHIFTSDFHEPKTPGLPNPATPNGPSPLEPCPTSLLLRPFWLMRALYQTLANPRGGYMSTRLFIPRGVWMVKNVKLKNVDDKIANCDFLTAALLKLGAVDTLDADAVLEEMQAFEAILDQAQASLAKKLGSEVGVQGLAALFKDMAPTSPDGSNNNSSSTASNGNTADGSTSTSTSSASRAFSSWRRLRSKSSGIGLTRSYTSSASSSSTNHNRNNAADTTLLHAMPTLPMTPTPSSRGFARRDVSSVQCLGPNAHYMSALVRLFDAAQVLDPIVRQCEDVGLRNTSKTFVGLELCARHAAEFFAFYVCRFVVGDVTLLLEKFIKRASEWVMA